MKLHQRLTALYYHVLSIVLVSATIQANAQDALTLKWGLENTDFFNEVKVTEEEYSPLDSTTTTKDYRYMKQNTRYAELLPKLSNKLPILWQEFKQDTHNHTSLSEQAFTKYILQKDSTSLTLAKSLYPALYFHFIGQQQDYTLESITITTLAYEEHKDACFSVSDAWYDIELRHMIGAHTFLVAAKPSFKGDVRAIFRFQSDNYSINSGTTPTGQFTLEIKFTFITKGKRVSVSTGVFKMDV